jgi:hypothetical protein
MVIHDLLLDAINFLVQVGAVAGDGIDSFRDTAPDSPDDIIVIYEYAGEPITLHGDIVHRSLQCVARSRSAGRAKVKATQLCNLLSPPGRFMQLTPTRWCQLYPRQTPFRIKIDANGRHYYGFNLGVTTTRD